MWNWILHILRLLSIPAFGTISCRLQSAAGRACGTVWYGVDMVSTFHVRTIRRNTTCRCLCTGLHHVHSRGASLACQNMHLPFQDEQKCYRHSLCFQTTWFPDMWVSLQHSVGCYQIWWYMVGSRLWLEQYLCLKENNSNGTMGKITIVGYYPVLGLPQYLR